MQRVIRGIPRQGHLMLLGDFNVRLGSDHDSRSSCLGPHGVGSMNENGQRLPELCTLNELCITNSFFQSKAQHKVSWRHPRPKHWHQLDLSIARRYLLQNVLLTRSYHSADCDTDHSLVCSKTSLRSEQVQAQAAHQHQLHAVPRDVRAFLTVPQRRPSLRPTRRRRTAEMEPPPQHHP